MKKLQQFNVYSFEYRRFKNHSYRIDISFEEAVRNEEIIALADNYCLKSIREISGSTYSEERLEELRNKARGLSHTVTSVEGKKEVARVLAEIDKLLFIPEFVSVTFDSKVTAKEYLEFSRDGFWINGKKYTWLMCSASHQRTNRAMYCEEGIYEELNRRLHCGAKFETFALAKYNAYYSLMSSATYEVTAPRVCVVADMEYEEMQEVDWVDEEDKITRQTRPILTNHFDGMGLISPEFARVWQHDLGCSYLPSSFMCRAPYVKGNLMVFDFHKFARGVAKTNKLKDIYGVEYDIENIDIILTQSQFKVWNGYTSWQEYEKLVVGNKLGWGVSRIPPEQDKDYGRVNYQFLQVLKMDDEQVADICSDTEQWLKGVCGEDVNKVILYLLGKASDESEEQKVWNRVQDNLIKCLMLDNRLANDEYVKNRIIKSLNKRIKESYIGKLLIRGNYQEIFADGYALCEHIFGMEVKGLLKKGEHYSSYWDEKGVTDIVAMRSPLTWRSEVNRLNISHSEEVREWFKYMKSGIIYNVWGADNMLQAGSDYDGDGVFTTDNKLFLDCRYGGVPVSYAPRKPKKEPLKKDRLIEVSFLGFNTKVGYITNLSTSMYEMAMKYDSDSEEVKELENRMKLCCYQQSQTIDSAKGIETTPLPTNWTRYTKGNDFSNKLIVEDRPYFMRYLYSTYNKQYNDTISDFDRYCISTYGKSYNDCLMGKDLENFEEVKNYYDKKLGFLTTDGTMNRICRYMEKSLKTVKKLGIKIDNSDIYTILIGGKYEPNKCLLDKLENKYQEYMAFKKSKQLAESDFATYEQYYKRVRESCLCEITNDVSELARLAVYLCYKSTPKHNKEFCWDCFSFGIMENLKYRIGYAKVPTLSRDYGTVEYLGKKYANNYLFFEKDDIDELCSFFEKDNIFMEDM